MPGGFKAAEVPVWVAGTAAEADGSELKILCCSSVGITAPAAAVGFWKVPSSFEIVSDFVLAYCICYSGSD